MASALPAYVNRGLLKIQQRTAARVEVKNASMGAQGEFVYSSSKCLGEWEKLK